MNFKFLLVTLSLLIVYSCSNNDVIEDDRLSPNFEELSKLIDAQKVGDIHTDLAQQLYNQVVEWEGEIPTTGKSWVFNELLLNQQSQLSGYDINQIKDSQEDLINLNLESLESWNVNSSVILRDIDNALFEDIMAKVNDWGNSNNFSTEIEELLAGYSDHYRADDLLAIHSVAVSSYSFWKEKYPELLSLKGIAVSRDLHPWARPVIGGDIKGAIGGSLFGGIAGALIGANAGTLLSIIECIGFGCE